MEKPKQTHKISKEKRKEAIQRVLAGESQAQLGRELGVTGAAVSLWVRAVTHPEKFRKKNPFKKRLTEEESKKLVELFETTTPEDHKLERHWDGWGLEQGRELAKKLFNKEPSVLVMKGLVTPFIPKRQPNDGSFPKPQPWERKPIEQLDPLLAADEDFVKYYYSKKAAELAQREYELALADWEARGLADEKPVEEEPFRPLPEVGKRIGKHAGNRGSNFTPKKKRRK